MIELHLVGRDEDGALLLDLTRDGVGRYRLRDSRRLRAELAPATPPAATPTAAPSTARRTTTPPAPATPRPTSSLSPAEIQDRLRRGQTPQAVARAAGTDLDWVRRWSGPVDAEVGRILEAVLSAPVVQHGRTSEGSVRELVAAWLPDGVEPDSPEWSAARRDDGSWRVVLRVEGSRGPLTASWSHDRATGATAPVSNRARDISFPLG